MTLSHAKHSKKCLVRLNNGSCASHCTSLRACKFRRDHSRSSFAGHISKHTTVARWFDSLDKILVPLVEVSTF
jgi:hypothetical protein